jgi:hypothetical protein
MKNSSVAPAASTDLLMVGCLYSTPLTSSLDTYTFSADWLLVRIVITLSPRTCVSGVSWLNTTVARSTAGAVRKK